MNVQIRQAVDIDTAVIVRRSKILNVPGAERTLWYCYNMSRACWVGMIEDDIACIWGLIPPSLLSNKAYLWLLTTDAVEEHKFTFVRQSQIFVQRMLVDYPIIVGHASTQNEKGIRWLKWLGATFGQPEGTRVPFQIVRQ